MNYLAHAYLSFDQPEILVGNMISDFVKGRKKFDYSPGIQKGIHLHRLIDSYTDEHPATTTAKQPLRPFYRLYSGAFVDVIYDHFLAKDSSEFSEGSLLNFSTRTYETLEPFQNFFPSRFAQMFPYMKMQNWLFNYRTDWGVSRSFEGVARRAIYIGSSDKAFEIFKENYDHFQQCYIEFWTDLKKYTLSKLHELD